MRLFTSKRSSSTQNDKTSKRLQKATKSTRLARAHRELPTFEAIEARQLMSATAVAAVNYDYLSTVNVRIGSFTIPEHIIRTQTAVFSIGANNAVYETTGPGKNVSLGGDVTEITAGLDANGLPEVYGMAPNGNTLVNDNGTGWTNLGGTVTQISASINGTVFGKAPDNTVWVDRGGSGWAGLGGQATQISAGVDAAGNPVVFATGRPLTAAFVNDGNGWVGLGGQFKQISATIDGIVYGIDESNDVEEYSGGSWKNLGGQATQISAGISSTGVPEVFATGLPATEVFQNTGSGWNDLHIGASEIAGASLGVAITNTSLGIVGENGQTFGYGASGWYSTSTELDPIEFKYQSLGGPSGSLGNPIGSEFNNGSAQIYQNGDIFYSPSTGAHVVSGEILQKYLQCNQTLVGFPTSDQLVGAGNTGYFNTFSNGAIYCGNNDPTHAFYVHGMTYLTWLNNGGPLGTIPGASGYAGYPTADTLNYNGGQVTYFQNEKVFGSFFNITTVPLHTSSLSFSSNYLVTSGPVGGNAQLTVHSDGTWALSYQFSDNAFFGTKYTYVVTMTLVSPTGNIFSFEHDYYIGAGGDHSTITGKDSRIAAYWNDLQGSTLTAAATCSNFSWTGFWGGLGIEWGTPLPGDDQVTGGNLYYAIDSQQGDQDYSEPDAPTEETTDPADPNAADDAGNPNSD